MLCGQFHTNAGRGGEMNYIDNKTHMRHVMTNLRRLIPWVLGAALIFMGIKMAFATFVAMN
jgi:hypothetical protein